MKQPEDMKTLELSLEEVKRGRGRPAKADALTPAQRAKRYRDAVRAGRAEIQINRDINAVTENMEAGHLVKAEDHARLRRMYWALENTIAQVSKQLELAEAERNTAYKENRTLKERGMELVRKFDLEHLARVDAESKLAGMKPDAEHERKLNQVKTTWTTVKRAQAAELADLKKINRGFQCEIEKLRDELTSRK